MLGSYVCRAAVLFTVGATFSLVFRIHQVQRSQTVPYFEPVHLYQVFSLSSSSDSSTDFSMDAVFTPAWWVPTACGIAAVLVGLLYPCVDRKLGETTFNAALGNKEWASVMRCTAIFVGINHVCARFDFPSNFQLTLTLTVMSAVLWWTFDRTRGGLGLGLGSALLALLVVQVLLEGGIYACSEKDVSHIRSWLPYVFFSGGITVGNIGRQLAMENQFESLSKRM